MPVHHVLPEIALVVGAVVSLLMALVLRQDRQHWAASGTAVGLVGAATATVWLAVTTEPQGTFHHTWALDDLTAAARLVVVAATAVCVAMAPRWLGSDRRHGEWYALVGFGGAGAMILAGAADVMELLVGMLLSGLTTVTLVGWHRRSRLSVEAGIKTFVIGSLANVLLLVGAGVFLGVVGTTGYNTATVAIEQADPTLVATAVVLIVGTLMFKAGAVPFHSWMPDAAQGAPAPSAAFVTVVPKVGALVAVVRIVSLLPDEVVAWRPLVAALAAVTMTLGHLAAMWQDDLRRLLGWSSVGQAGYALMAAVAVGRSSYAVGGMMLFLAAYAVAQLAAFGVVTVLRGRTSIDDYAGLARTRPWAAVALALALLSFVGIPPLAGFAGKLALFSATIEADYGWLAVVAVVNTVISLFVYLRVIGPMVLAEPHGDVPLLGRWSATATAVTTALVLAVGLGAEAILGPLRDVPFVPF